MLILAIESSCDETAAAVVRDGRTVLSNIIASQHDLHAEYGGVVPEIASRAHVERILPVVEKAVVEAGIALSDLDAIAVGHRPGLIGSLLVGVGAAKGLAWSLGVPLIGIDHVQAHLWSGMLGQSQPGSATDGKQDLAVGPGVPLPAAQSSGHPLPEGEGVFPALGLVVSGGHTAMFRCDGPLRSARLGTTIDDAVGEAYDKVAALLELGHPGGPRVDALARQGNDRAHEFPRSRLSPDSLDFSFSGLKTAVLYRVRGYPGMEDPPSAPSDAEKADIAASFQRAAVGVLLLKMERALLRLRHEGIRVRSLIIGGGVSANSRLREELARFAGDYGVRLILPPMEYCMDNAAMIAGLAHHRLIAGDHDDLTLCAEPSTALQPVHRA